MTTRGSDGGALDYRRAGVDIDAADEAKRRIKAHVESTRTALARGAFGGFAGMLRAPTDVPKPVLVASADGVGTKVKVASATGRNDTVGHDLVNHCVNDILVQGATPLFFLDYVASGRLDPDVAEALVAGVAAGCRENGCALLGGEMAEMPGIYAAHDYDLAGFIVGYVDEDSILGDHRVRVGDALVGLESSGLHTNGYSLARRIVADRMRLAMDAEFPGERASVADVLLRVHRSYLPPLRRVLPSIHAMAHITGGGIPGNLRRVIPPNVDAVVRTDTWIVPNVFEQLADAGSVDRSEMFRAFNMGVGMIVLTNPADVDTVIASATSHGVRAWRLGETVAGSGRVILNAERTT